MNYISSTYFLFNMKNDKIKNLIVSRLDWANFEKVSDRLPNLELIKIYSNNLRGGPQIIYECDSLSEFKISEE